MKSFEPIHIGSNKEDAKENILDAIKQLPKVRTAIERMNQARNLPEIKSLLSEVWKTNELHVLFADTGIGKSIFAMNVSIALSKGDKFLNMRNENHPLRVLYYDFELSDKQYFNRFSNNEKEEYEFNENFLIDTIDFAQLLSIQTKLSFSEILFQKITYDIQETGAQVLVIDNLTCLNSQSTQDTQIALDVMRELNVLKSKYNLSILVLAHTPKRNLTSPITINDVAGSKHITNFADSVSTIGRSAKDKDIRYFKQVKPSRSAEMLYDTENVITCRIAKIGSLLTFEFIDYSSEFEHLQEPSSFERETQKQEQRQLAIKLKEEGRSYAEIAQEVFGDSNRKSSAYRLLNN